jgi:hypothetical protein
MTFDFKLYGNLVDCHKSNGMDFDLFLTDMATT